jgi:hypothetical protein
MLISVMCYLRQTDHCGRISSRLASDLANGTFAGFQTSPSFEPIDRECYEVLSLMRSLCVSTWCWRCLTFQENSEQPTIT